MNVAAAEGFLPVDDDGQGADANLQLPGLPMGPNPCAVVTVKAMTRAGFVHHVDSCVRQLAAWLGAGGDAHDSAPGGGIASADNSRLQLWQWLHGGDAALDDGTPIDFALFDAAVQRVGERLPRRGLAGQGNVLRAAWLLTELTYARTLADPAAIAAPARGC